MVTSVHSASGDTGDIGEGEQLTRKAHWSHMLHNPTAHVLSTDAIGTIGTATTSGSPASDVCCTLLDAMEGACRGVLSLVCRVLRVYRRAVYTAGTLFS